MVVFTCNRCGESLKKKDVEKHCYGRCRGPPFLTCVDCLKDFREDFAKHFLCISEDNRYSANGLKNKTLTKQQKWVMLVHQTCEKHLAENKVDQSTQSLLEYLMEYPSIPDKEKAFRNFVANLRKYNANSIQTVWHILQQAKTEDAKKTDDLKRVNGSLDNKTSNGLTETDIQAKADKLPEHSNINEEQAVKANAVEHNTSDMDRSSKKKKKKKKGDKSFENFSTENNCLLEDSNTEAISGTMGDVRVEITKLSKKERKERKKKGDKSFENFSTENNCQLEDSNTEAISGTMGDEQVEITKLSKKERKERKKKLKYEAQIEEIMNQDNVNNASVEDECEEPSKKKKKKKKGSAETNHTEEVQNPEPCNTKNKKRKQGDVNKETEDVLPMKKFKKCEDDDEDNAQNSTEVCGKPNSTFSWESTILQVLESKDDKEISLKRLSKKVINEYLLCMGDSVHVDEAKLGSKLLKKLSKMHNILLHKDKVKVKSSRI